MKPRNLIELQRAAQPAEVALAALRSTNRDESTRAGIELVQDARNLGLDARDYLRLAIDTKKGDFAGAGLDGYEAALAYLQLPLRDDFSKGVLLEAAAETFQVFPGARAMFPVVMDDIVQWKYRQDEFELVAPLVSQTRSISGTELISTVVDDKEADYTQYGVIAEGANIPVRSIRMTEKSVRIYKFGGGIRTTYEFNRRASLDIVTPYAARMEREVERAQVGRATAMLLNGDSVHGAATTVNAATIGAAIGVTTTAGKMNWEVFLKWLIDRAKAGTPVDTVTGNYDLHFEWMRMFATPTAAAGMSQGELLQRAGVQAAIQNPRFSFNVNFAVSTAMPGATLLGFSKNDTLEELVENGSDISESETAIKNQTVTYVKTRNAGYRLVYGDTRATLVLN